MCYSRQRSDAETYLFGFAHWPDGAAKWGVGVSDCHDPGWTEQGWVVVNLESPQAELR